MSRESSDAIETFRQIMMGVSSNSKESYDYYKNAPKNELADHLLEMWCEDQDDFDRPTLGSSYNSYVEMMDASRKSKKAESFNSTWVVRFDAPAWEKDDIDVMFKECHFETEEKARAFKEYMERDVGVSCRIGSVREL